ncbi:TPA: restriction endonuclease subunit S [Neisseria meningitidis]
MDMQSKAKKLIEMIQTASVEWKPLGEVAKVLRGKRLTKKELIEGGKYPVFHGGLIPLGWFDQFNRRANQTMIINTGSIGEVIWSGVDFWSSDGTFVIQTPNYLDDKFIFYFLKTREGYLKSQKRVGGVPTIDRLVVENISIPIPPLETQQKIVKILDKFTELEATLEATLEAELALRKRQYQYYRDFLLDFDNQIGGGIADDYKGRLKDVVWKTLGEIAEYSKNRICSDKLNEHNYVGVDNLLQNREGKKLSGYVPSEGKMTEYIVNDILIGNIRPYLKKIWQADCTGGTNGDVLVIRVTDEKVNPKYLYQVLADDKFFAFNMKHAKGAKMPRGSKTAIMQYKIPIPPLPEQEKIVAILDKFDTLTHSISEGLPHEIALRRKQYEYYREQLLAFR